MTIRRLVLHDSVKIDYADADLRVGLAGFRVAGLAEGAAKGEVRHARALRLRGGGRRIGECRIYREHRHLAVVEAVETYLLAVRRPPECLVAGRTAEYFLIVHP